MQTPQVYEIRVEGRLKSSWAEWFEDLVIDEGPDGETVFTGPLQDQAALYGVLMKIRDLGLTLVAVNRRFKV